MNFVESPPKQIPVECTICFDVLFQPKMVSCCGHSFCAACIGRVERDHKPCPLCGQEFSLVDDKRLVRTLNEFSVYCPHQESGCEWKGELGELPRHLSQDPKSDKLIVGCQFQEILCGLCQSYSCERRLMTDHVSTWCPNRDVECEYHFAGCDVKEPKGQLDSHGREAVSHHLSLVATLVQGSLSQKDKEIEELKEELRRQGKQIQELKQQQRLTGEAELRQKRHTNRDRHWILLLLLMIIIGSIIHARMYIYTDSSIDLKEANSELSSKIKNVTFHHQLLKEQFTNSRMNVSNLIAGFHGKLQELETGIGQINRSIQKVEGSVVKIWQETSKMEREQILESLGLSDLTEKNAKDLGNVNSNEMISINESLEYVKKQLVAIESEIHYLGQQADFSVLPVYLNMTNFEEYNVSKGHWLSEPFYTHEGGYKMRLVVYPNRKYSGAGTHISVAIFLMSGKYDYKLDWPLNMILNVTLLNQDSENKDPISRVFDCSTSAYDIQSLGRVWNSTMAKTGIILSKFMAYHSTKSPKLRSYVKHDSLYFRVDKVRHEVKAWRREQPHVTFIDYIVSVVCLVCMILCCVQCK